MADTVDASIPLAGGYGPNMGAAISQGLGNAQQMLQLREFQQQQKRVNALRDILGRPGAIDAVGQPTPETLSGVMRIDPAAGLKLGENALMTQQRKLQVDALRTRAVSDKADMLNSTYAPILETYERALQPGSKISPQQAMRDAQTATTEATQRLRTSGGLSPEEANALPSQFNPQAFRAKAMGFQQYQQWLKEVSTDRHQREQEKIERERIDAASKAGQWTSGVGNDESGNQVPGMYFTPKSGGTPVFHPGVVATAKSGARQTADVADDSAIDADLKQKHPDWTAGQIALERKRLGKQATTVVKPEDPTKGWEILTDPANNEQYQHRKGTGESKTLTGEPYIPAGAQKLAGPRAQTAVLQEREATRGIIMEGYEKELGRPIDPKNGTDVNEINRRVQAAEDRRKVQLAGDKTAAMTSARQAAEILGVPETPEAKTSLAAQAATGQPLSQIVMGYGKSAVQARKEAREGAIQKIMDDTGMDASQAGIELAMRGIEFATGKRSDAQLGTIRGATVAAVKQLDYNIDQVLEDFKKIPGTDISPIINALVRGEQNITGDPQYKKLFFHMQAVANESARILSGGQASIAQLAEGARKEAEKWASVNMTPASFREVADGMREEGKARIRSFDETRSEQRLGASKKSESVSVAPVPGAKATPQQMRTLPKPKDPNDARKLEPGTSFILPDDTIGVVPGAPAPTSLAPPAVTRPAAIANPNDLPDGSIVKQGGKRYRKKGNDWIEE